MYDAKVLAHSIANGEPLMTMQATFPRFILAEINTHRMFSRNSASSRAIPVEKRIEQVCVNPFIPEAFGKNKSGMQATDVLGRNESELARMAWLDAASAAVIQARHLASLGVHKQHANRILEPFVWHTAVISGTADAWANFFALRTHKAAQPEMQIIAKLMKEAYDASTPEELDVGDWHLPYIARSPDSQEYRNIVPAEMMLAREIVRVYGGDDSHASDIETALCTMSVVRCAAVSFERQYAERIAQQYYTRAEEMRKLAHWSPFEHQAYVERMPLRHGNGETRYVGNFAAPWMQYRKTFRGENIWRGGEVE